MSLGGADLNLLLPLKVLLEEGNVTRAGQRLELSQPAMSTALARLRRRFDDELLVRSGRDYELTPLARQLLPEVQHAVRLLGRALHLEEEFDPATSDRTFTLGMSDYAISVLHEPLVRLLEAQAPGSGSSSSTSGRTRGPRRAHSSTTTCSSLRWGSASRGCRGRCGATGWSSSSTGRTARCARAP